MKITMTLVHAVAFDWAALGSFLDFISWLERKLSSEQGVTKDEPQLSQDKRIINQKNPIEV